MSVIKVGASLVILAVLSGCATADKERAETVERTAYSTEIQAPLMRHTIREEVSFDAYRMTRLVNKELNMKENDEDNFLRDATFVLSQTVLVQPHFAEREVGLREIKSKLEPEDYNYILGKASEQLIYIATKSELASDQASALLALNNLVVEARSLHRAELKPTIERIAKANLHVSEEAKQYAREPMAALVSPSSQAQVALQNF